MKHLLFIEPPSVIAPIAEWYAYQLRLQKLNPHNRTVVEEKRHATRIIALLEEELILDNAMLNSSSKNNCVG